MKNDTQSTSPVVSIIMPCYNHGDYINEAIDSVLAQTFQDFEIVIVDDASSDGKTPAIVESMKDKDNRISVYYFKENRKAPKTYNYAAGKSKGTYILPLDADDKITPDCLEKAIKAMEQQKADVVYWKIQHFGASNILRKIPKNAERFLPFKNYIVSCSLYKKSDWEKYNGYNENMNEGYEDWDFWLCFYEDGKKFVFLDELLFYYRIGDRGVNYNAGKHWRKLKRQLQKNHPTLYTMKNYYLTSTYIARTLRYLRREIIQIRINKKQKIIKILGFDILHSNKLYKD